MWQPFGPGLNGMKGGGREASAMVTLATFLISALKSSLNGRKKKNVNEGGGKAKQAVSHPADPFIAFSAVNHHRVLSLNEKW